MLYVYAIALILANTFFLALTVLGLPGNWLMVFAIAGLAYMQRDPMMFSPLTLGAIFALALLGEILEFALGAAGARKAGGTRWGAIGALFGAILGGILGTFLILIPVVGSILGACGGAFLGALAAEKLFAQRNWRESFTSGGGAAKGRLYGTLAKLTLGAAIWLLAAFTAFWP